MIKTIGSKILSNNIPSTHGGDGWQKRTKSCINELQEGKIWHKSFCNSEINELNEVILTVPHEKIFYNKNPKENLFFDNVNGKKLIQQTNELIKIYENNNIKVHKLELSHDNPYPNLLFLRDLFWPTPQGVILCRPASMQRSGEERFIAEKLSEIGIPVTMHIRGTGLFEGADALWLNNETVLIGTGFRTNNEGADQIKNFLSEIGVKTIKVKLERGVQHLLGILNFLTKDTVTINYKKASNELLKIIQDFGFNIVKLFDEKEIDKNKGMNFVNLGNNKILMPKGTINLISIYKSFGLEILEADISEYLKAAGGIGCCTGVIYRKNN